MDNFCSTDLDGVFTKLGPRRNLPFNPPWTFVKMESFVLFSVSYLDEENCQSPIASVQRTQSTLASHSAVPRGTITTPTPIARFESQHNERRVYGG